MKVVLAGGKKITYYLAKNLTSKGMAVTIINKDKAFCEEMAKTLKALIIHGDASNLSVLKKVEIFDNDLVVALTNRDQDNLIICELAARVLKVNQVFSLINDSENEQIFRELGITNTINMSEIFTGVIEQRLASYPIINLMPFEEGKALVIQIEVEEGFPIVGKWLKDLPFAEGALVGTVNRKGNVFIPHGDTVFEVGDRLLVICLPVDQTQTLQAITGWD